jgi:TrmH family RNA methyltransferase
MPHESRPDRDQPESQSLLNEIGRLQADRAHREARGTFFVEGVRNVVQAIENGFPIEALVHSDRLLKVAIARRLVRERRRSGTPTLHVTSEDFRQISKTQHASGVGAVVGQRWSSLHSTSPKAGLCWVVLDAVRSEGNLGSLVRTSEAIGGAGFILVGPRVDPYDPAVVRASMGAHFRQAFIRTNTRSLGNWLRRHRCRAVGASPDGPIELHRFGFPGPTVLMLGEERGGLTPWQRELCPELVRIPTVGAADSLNLAVAGSLLLYEVYRARSMRGA